MTSLPFTNSVIPRYQNLPRCLGSANPCAKAVHMEPFSTQSSIVAIEYLLLQSRSALYNVAPDLTISAYKQSLYPPTPLIFLLDQED